MKLDLRDGDPVRYLGKGVLKAVENVNGAMLKPHWAKSLNQRQIDELLIALDGTPNKAKLGAKCDAGARRSLALQLRVKQTLWSHLGVRQPNAASAMMNITNGGAHADNNVDFREFMIIPVSAPSFREGFHGD